MSKSRFRGLRFAPNNAMYLVGSASEVKHLSDIISTFPVSLQLPRRPLGRRHFEYLGLFDLVVAHDTDGDYDAIINVDRYHETRDSKGTDKIFRGNNLGNLKRLMVGNYDDVHIEIDGGEETGGCIRVTYKLKPRARKVSTIGVRFWDGNSTRDA